MNTMDYVIARKDGNKIKLKHQVAHPWLWRTPVSTDAKGDHDVSSLAFFDRIKEGKFRINTQVRHPFLFPTPTVCGNNNYKIVDDCLYEGGLSLEDLRAELDPPDPLYFQERLARAHHNGCSSFRDSLDCCIKVNRSGPNESHLSREAFVKKYLTRRRAFERIDRE